jgi:hypothetical protein
MGLSPQTSALPPPHVVIGNLSVAKVLSLVVACVCLPQIALEYVLTFADRCAMGSPRNLPSILSPA